MLSRSVLYIRQILDCMIQLRMLEVEMAALQALERLLQIARKSLEVA